MDNPTLAQTTFYLNVQEHSDQGLIYLHLDQGGYKPSPEERSFAPFFQASSQPVLVVSLSWCNIVFVVKTDALLRLARERRGTELQWEQWKSHAVEVQLGGRGAAVWVSGPRFFCVYRAGGGIWLEVHDFSPRASARHMRTTTGQDGAVRQMARKPTMRKLCLPPNTRGLRFPGGGHDSIAFPMVNALPAPQIQNLTQLLYDRVVRVAD